MTQASHYGKQTEVFNGVDVDLHRAVRAGRDSSKEAWPPGAR